MKLEIQDALEAQRTGRRVMPLIPDTPGYYCEVDAATVAHSVFPEDMYRMEARIGCQFTMPYGAPKGMLEDRAATARRSVVMHLYGEIQSKMVMAKMDLRSTGLPEDHPALRSITDIINSIDKAARP